MKYRTLSKFINLTCRWIILFKNLINLFFFLHRSTLFKQPAVQKASHSRSHTGTSEYYKVFSDNVNITFFLIKAQFDASLSIQHNEFPGFHLFHIEIFGYSDVNPWKPILDKNALPVAAPSCRWSWYLPRKILHSNKKRNKHDKHCFIHRNTPGTREMHESGAMKVRESLTSVLNEIE